VQAAGFESYPHRVVPLFIGTPNAVGVFDQLDLARGLLDEMQAIASDLGITADAGLSGVTRTIDPDAGKMDPFAGTYNSARSFGDALGALADRDDGFDWTIDCFHDSSGARRRHLRFGYPRLGRADARHALADPGNILDWSWDEDGTRGGTEVRVRGGQVPLNNEMVPASDYGSSGNPAENRYDTARLAAGWPVLTVVVDDASLTTREQIRARVRTELPRLSGAVVTPSVSVRLSETSITPQHLGDAVEITISDIWWQPELRATARMVGFKVRPPSRGQEESMEIYLEGTDAVSATA
jgi:hypothetical protein